MPSNNDRIIFQHAEEQPISENEFEKSQTPYEQTETLKHRLIFWTATATKELDQYGYSCADTRLLKKMDLTKEEFEAYRKDNLIEKIIFAEDINEDETIYHYPGVIPPDAAAAERAACHVLKTAMALWDAIFTDNKYLIANLGLEFGLAVASAHAVPFEELTIKGDTFTRPGRAKGAKSKKMQHIESLVNESANTGPWETARKLWKKSNKTILGDMPYDNFEKRVSDYRKKTGRTKSASKKTQPLRAK